MQSGSEVTWDGTHTQCVMGVHVARDCVKVIKWGLLSRICFLFMQVATEDFISSFTACHLPLWLPSVLLSVWCRGLASSLVQLETALGLLLHPRTLLGCGLLEVL